MKVTGRFVAIAMVMAASFVGNASTERATASTQCDGSQPATQVGYTGYTSPPPSWAQTPEGVSAYVMTRNGPICPNYGYPYDFSSAWVMLQDFNTGDHYAQAGYMWDSSAGCMRLYVEWNIGPTNSDFHRGLGACALQGQVVTSRVEYNGAPGPYPPTTSTMLLSAQQGGSSEVLNAPFDPWQQGWSFSPSFAGEVVFSGPDDVTGSIYEHTDMTSMGIQQVSSGNLVTIPCYLAGVNTQPASPNRYYRDASGCNHIWVYTYPF